MENLKYKAFIVEETHEKTFVHTVGEACTDDLPQGDVLVRVRYSSLNYKDALSASGNRGVTRQYPHTPGIDAAGIVEHSRAKEFKPGDPVIVTSYDLGMNTPGGFGQYIRVPGDWVVPLPQNLSLEQSMILGTAGFTAAMSVERLISGVTPDQGPILVTGATGGVGSLACAILVKLGYSVDAVSGKPDDGFLKSLGVKEIISRKIFLEKTAPPVLKPRWAGVVDTVGGEILATAIKSTGSWGIVTCCGNVASPDLPINVFPFILRGVSLIGIDSQHCPMPLRQTLWKNLSAAWKPDQLENLCSRIGLDDLSPGIEKILKGQLRGRTLVDMG
ncbi:MAG: YhdH/YhfP family quinone oxidoreductase [Proteobacteria bacterium]|nr:acryloyl-CoA reductase [Desulfobacula sp.]MBU3952830.1 YhdH/YhfP family quinone oxidoreductase [Pseudomonadota bacterium]MBU4131064.1 YhdH/YhfP family quinone oxidoreductase [Pseudomonadota bacterium]